MPFERDRAPKHFWESFEGGRCGVFVGAGLSVASGLPTWRGLLGELIDFGLSRDSIDKSRESEYRDATRDSAKFLMLATELKEALGSHFADFIQERFGTGCPKPTATHVSLAKAEKIRFLVTTNYDVLLDEALIASGRQPRVRTLTYKDANQIQRSLFRREFFYLKAHGDAMKAADEIILTEHDYRRVLYKEPGYRSALEAMFMFYSIVFVGSSLTDPEVNLLLQYINAAFAEPRLGHGPTHYAVIGKGKSSNLERERWRKDFGVHFIEVSPDNDYQELGEFVELLSK